MGGTIESCAACGNPSTGEYSIHRDYGCKGPEVPLCNACGAGELPTCETLWAMIRQRLASRSISGEIPG